MHQYLDVSRAAKLAGVAPAEIQRLIDEQVLPIVEGKVDLEDLVRVFPEIETSRSFMGEVTDQIKDDAVLKATRMRPGYRKRDLIAMHEEVVQLQQDVLFYKEIAHCYKQILIELRPKLEDLQEKSEHKNKIQTIVNWFVHKTKELW